MKVKFKVEIPDYEVGLMKYLNDISYKDCVDKVCKSLNSGDFKDTIADVTSQIDDALSEIK